MSSTQQMHKYLLILISVLRMGGPEKFPAEMRRAGQSPIPYSLTSGASCSCESMWPCESPQPSPGTCEVPSQGLLGGEAPAEAAMVETSAAKFYFKRQEGPAEVTPGKSKNFSLGSSLLPETHQ